MRKRSVLCFTITTLLSTAICVYGQATSGSVIGSVTDPAGAAIPAAKVTITSQERGTIYSTRHQRVGKLHPDSTE